MNEYKKEEAAKHIKEELCFASMNISYEVRCMLDACEEAVIDEVLEIIEEISDSTCITFGTITYSDGKGELRNRVLALKGGEQE